MKGKAHSPEIKARAISGLLAGETVTEVAANCSLPETTVSKWKSEIPTEKFAEVCSKKKETLLELVEGHLRSSLKAAISLATKSSTDDKWFSRQNAHDIAMLYGVLSDKSIRLIEAAQQHFTAV